jgi:hypothetical protein
MVVLAPPLDDERRWNMLRGFKGVHPKSGSSQGQNLALTGLFVPGVELADRRELYLVGAALRHQLDRLLVRAPPDVQRS